MKDNINAAKTKSANKRSFNIIDAIIILIVLIGIGLGVFLLMPGGVLPKDNENVKLEYVVEVRFIKDGFSDNVTVGELVTDSVSKNPLGKIVSLEKIPYLSPEVNKEEQSIILTEYPDRSNLLLTIQADATVTEKGYMLNGNLILVGKSMYLRFSDFVGSGYVIGFSKVNN